MEIIRVGIDLADRDFAEALARGIAEESSHIRISLIEEPEEGMAQDLLLTDRASSAEKAVFLSEERTERAVCQKEPYRLYRFLDSREMAEALRYIYFARTGRVYEPKVKNGCPRIGLCSLQGGAGTTTMGIFTARMVYRLYGCRCLYLSLSSCSGLSRFFKESPKAEFLKLLYFLDKGRDFPLSAFITEAEELDYVDTESINLHYQEMSEGMLNRFSARAEASGRYGFLFLDIGNHLNTETKRILENSDGVLFLQREGAEAGREGRAWQKEKGEPEGPKVLQVCAFAEGEPEDSEREDEGSGCSISRTENLSLEENFGTEISRIARWVMEETGNG